MTAPQLAPGSVVAGKYSIAATLGFGGSSATYHAVAADGREVALKIFDPAIRQRSDIMAAIEQTYAATNALPTDVVVPLLDAGYDPQTGAPFSVTERIPYPSLAQLVAQRPLTPEELSTMLGFMARALDAAHQMQLCHHALKPTNIFVGFTQGYGVRLTDFGAGLARAAVPTQEGYTLSAPWLAPEQVQGTVAAGPSADVFATALIAFFALTGRPYWQSCQGALDLGLWQQELMSPRTPPSARARELGLALNPAFDSVLGAAIAVDPSQRYRSVGELAAAMDSLIAAKGPETAATMAFPAMGMGLPGANDYPPPPAPTGGLGMSPPGPGPGMAPPAQEPVQAQPPAMGPPGQGGGSYPSTGMSEPDPRPTDYMIRPGDPSAPRRANSNKMVPILVGVAALVVLGGGLAAFLVMGGKSDGTGDESAAATASATAGPSEAPSGTPAADTSAAATASAEPSATASETAPPPPPPQELTVTCSPTCDEVKLDDQVVDISKPIELSAGDHTLTGTKAGYNSATEKLKGVEGGPKMTKKLTLTPIRVAGPSPGPKPVSSPKPCGKFLKKNCK